MKPRLLLALAAIRLAMPGLASLPGCGAFLLVNKIPALSPIRVSGGVQLYFVSPSIGLLHLEYAIRRNVASKGGVSCVCRQQQWDGLGLGINGHLEATVLLPGNSIIVPSCL